MFDVLSNSIVGIPIWLWLVGAVALLFRPAMIIALPDDMCGPGGWLIDTNVGGWFGDSDGDGDGGDGGD